MKQYKLLYLLFSICLLLPLAVSAQTKIEERSEKKRPVWVGGSQQDYIITMAIEDNLEKAKNVCLENVRKQIIESVALNVKESTSSSLNQETYNSEITKFLETFTSNSATQAANVPFLKGISASKIEAFYWEKSVNKKTHEVLYTYSIKYPLPSGELKRMVMEFDKRDKEMATRYTTLEQELTDITSVEQIDNAITELEPLITYFFDDTRKTAAQSLQAAYRKLYHNITYSILSNNLNEGKYALLLNSRRITTSQRPSFKANCASQITVEQSGTEYVLNYNSEDCIKGEENFVDAIYRFGSKQLKIRFNFNIK
ncbi:MAG: hypothetical protein RR555_05095 [Bacteroidales bacterium]